MLCFILHIRKDKKYHSYSDHRKQVNNVIKELFHGASENEMAVTQDIFLTEYTEFDNNISSFDADEFIWKSKDIRDGNSNLWHQNIFTFLSQGSCFCCMYSHIKGSCNWCSRAFLG